LSLTVSTAPRHLPGGGDRRNPPQADQLGPIRIRTGGPSLPACEAPASPAAGIEDLVDDIWAFLAMTVLLSISPGPDDVLVLRSSLRGGTRLGMATVGGVAVGSLAWGVAAAVGLSAVVARSAPVYEALRLGGACYLVLLGAVPLLAEVRGRARRVATVFPLDPVERLRAPGGAGCAFSAGVMSDLLNPKIGLFYLAVVPQFVPAGAPALQYSLALCAIDICVAVSWLAALTWVAHAAVNWLLRPVVVLWSQRIFSALLIGLGASTAVGL
jgi:threonine/homoserine/homoserine lactone efflux protein